MRPRTASILIALVGLMALAAGDPLGLLTTEEARAHAHKENRVGLASNLVPQDRRLVDLPCQDGFAAIPDHPLGSGFACDGVDLLSFVPLSEFEGDTSGALLGAGASDLWGWTDPETGDEYVILGKTNGVAFFRVTDPFNPEYLGEVPNQATVQLVWHDIKVYQDHAFWVSESNAHGMRVFDLTRLRGVSGEAPQTFTADAEYPLVVAAHNLAINEETGFAYIVGGNTALVLPDQCLSGLHMVDISTPTLPVFAGCFPVDGGPGTLARTIGGPALDLSPVAYVHDTQCVVYRGPDTEHDGREVCFNSSEDQLTIVDVTDKALPQTLGTLEYPDVGYAHQGWLSSDQAYFFLGDELDETDVPLDNTRTLVFDVTDLDDPTLHFEHFHATTSIDHNMYTDGRLLFQSNYTTGLRVLNTTPVAVARQLPTVAFFDTFPDNDDPVFSGTWSNYPYFESGTIPVSGIDEGLFLLRLHEDVDSLRGQ